MPLDDIKSDGTTNTPIVSPTALYYLKKLVELFESGGDSGAAAQVDIVKIAGEDVDPDEHAIVEIYSDGVNTSRTNPVPVANSYHYETVAASQTDQMMGATGAVGDYLAGVLIVPATTSPGAVLIQDGNGTEITIFANGASSVTTLHPFFVPIGAKCVAVTTPGWKLTTGTNVSAVGLGTFT